MNHRRSRFNDPTIEEIENGLCVRRYVVRQDMAHPDTAHQDTAHQPVAPKKCPAHAGHDE
jgi:hypothetical protein